MHGDLRFATERDIPAIVGLVNLAFTVENFFKRTERTDEQEVTKRVSRGRFLLLEQDGALIASLYIELRNPVGYLGMLAVAPSHQRRGLGRRMMAAGDEFCREAGCREVELTVINLRTELPPIYEKLGYRVVGTAPYSHDPARLRVPCSFLVMRKALGQAIE